MCRIVTAPALDSALFVAERGMQITTGHGADGDLQGVFVVRMFGKERRLADFLVATADQRWE